METLGSRSRCKSWIAQPAVAAFGLVVLSFLPYIPALHGEFLWDDNDIYIVNNPLMRDPEGWHRAWFTTDTVDYFPLTYSLFWIQWRAFGENPIGYRVTNILLHGGCSLLVWCLARRLPVPSPWLVAAIFAVHPLNVETVAWISQLKALLATFFGFLSLLYFWRYESEKRQWQYVASIIAFALSLAGKPTLVALPVVFAGIAWWRNDGTLLKVFKLALPHFALSVLFGLVGLWFHEVQVVGDHVVRDDSLLERTLTAGWAFWFYVYKSVFPFNLMFVYPRWSVNAASILAWIPAVSVLALMAWLLTGKRPWRKHGAAIVGYFLLSMAPVLGFLDVYYWTYSFVADHYVYQSLPIVIVALTSCTWIIAGSLLTKWKKLNAFMCTAVLAALLWLSWDQASIYKTQESVWRHTLSKNPYTILARNNLGLLLRDQGRLDEARSHYIQSLQWCPQHPEIYNNLGVVYLRMSRTTRGDESATLKEKAIECYQNAARLATYSRTIRDVYDNLVTLLIEDKRFKEAETAIRKSIQLVPDQAHAYCQLGQLHYERKELDEAEIAFKDALVHDAKHAATHYHYAMLLEDRGKREAAVNHYRKSIEFSTSPTFARINLGVLLHQMDNRFAGYHQLVEASEAGADDSETCYRLGVAFAFLNYTDEAISACARALELDPEYVEAKQLLASLKSR